MFNYMYMNTNIYTWIYTRIKHCIYATKQYVNGYKLYPQISLVNINILYKHRVNLISEARIVTIIGL